MLAQVMNGCIKVSAGRTEHAMHQDHYRASADILVMQIRACMSLDKWHVTWWVQMR
jgi:hypothetical protein